MGIDVYLQDEAGSDLGACYDPQMLFPKMLRTIDASGTSCVRFIDQYGDTTFNRAQVEVLLEELQTLRPRVDTRTRAVLDSIIELGMQVRSGTHLYLKFVGD